MLHGLLVRVVHCNVEHHPVCLHVTNIMDKLYTFHRVQRLCIYHYSLCCCSDENGLFLRNSNTGLDHVSTFYVFYVSGEKLHIKRVCSWKSFMIFESLFTEHTVNLRT
jgi:hypothetical protein